jgi:hypothetical protein
MPNQRGGNLWEGYDKHPVHVCSKASTRGREVVEEVNFLTLDLREFIENLPEVLGLFRPHGKGKITGLAKIIDLTVIW